MRQLLLSSLALILLGTMPAARAASVPMTFTHHGIIWDGDELLNDSHVDFEARLLDVSQDTPEIIASFRDYIEVQDGYYAITIKDIDKEKFLAASGHLELQIIISGEALTPNLPVSSVPFALVANEADHALIADAASELTCQGCITKEHLDDSVLSNYATSSDLSVYAKSADVASTYILKNSEGNLNVAHAVSADAASSVAWANISGKPSLSLSNHTHQYAGSSSAGGSANSAVKLDTSAGSTSTPVYFKDGKPSAVGSIDASLIGTEAITTSHIKDRTIINSDIAKYTILYENLATTLSDTISSAVQPSTLPYYAWNQNLYGAIAFLNFKVHCTQTAASNGIHNCTAATVCITYEHPANSFNVTRS